jgi:hypothetical protein
METDPVSETLCSSVFLEYRTMDKVQKPNSPEGHTSALWTSFQLTIDTLNNSSSFTAVSPVLVHVAYIVKAKFVLVLSLIDISLLIP